MSPRANLRVAPLPRSTASLVPHFDVTVHIVLDDFGKAGRVYRETDEEDTTVGPGYLNRVQSSRRLESRVSIL
jgi:hypothetical protein